MDIKSLIQTGVFNFQYKFRKMTIISRMNLNEIKLSTKPSRKSSTSGVVCWKRFIKWVDDILQRLDIFLEVPECMKLATNVFTVNDQQLTPENFNEKVTDLRGPSATYLKCI